MRTRRKYLDFKITNKEWEEGRPFITLPESKDRRTRALMRWGPNLYKATWMIRLTNSHTKEKRVHTLERVERIYEWLVVVWNPTELLDTILDFLPVTIAASVIMGAAAQVSKEEHPEEAKEVK